MLALILVLNVYCNLSNFGSAYCRALSLLPSRVVVSILGAAVVTLHSPIKVVSLRTLLLFLINKKGGALLLKYYVHPSSSNGWA